MSEDEVSETNGQIEEEESPPIIEGIDYYLEDGLFVFTREFLLRRGYCCESGCRNCPYPREVRERAQS